MLLSFLGIKASGLQRSHIFFVMIGRFFKRSFKNFQRFLLTFILLVSLVIFFFFSEKEDGYWKVYHDWLGEVAVTGMYYIQSPFKAIGHYCQTHASLQEQVQSLTLENQKLRQLEQQTISFQKENKILRKLAKVVEDQSLETLTVKVLGSPADHLSTTLVIEKKPSLNLQKNQVVLSSERGVIGRIYKVGSACAWVLLITDSRSRIPARIVSSGEQVILVGENTGELKVLHAASTQQAYSPPQKGDLLVTSGYGGIYPPGLPIAQIISFNEGVLKASVLSEEYGEFITILKNVIPNENDNFS